MAFEMLVALKIKNNELYTKYREKMAPLLKTYGGGFRYDFKVSEVLKNEEGRAIDRVFVIYFKDKASRDEFFINEEYLKIKKQFFDDSVEDRTLVAEYNR